MGLEKIEEQIQPQQSSMKKIATAIGNKNKVNLGLRDISKAFDKVWHDGLTLYGLIFFSSFFGT